MRDPLDLDTIEGRFVLNVLLERRRFLFQHRAIGELLDRYPGAAGRNPFLQSMAAFAMLQAPSSSFDDGMAAVRSAWNISRDAPLASATADVCLHAIWLSHRLPDQGVILLEFCDRAEREGRPSAVIRRFRRATALRLLGRYTEAVDEIDGVLESLSGSSEFTGR